MKTNEVPEKLYCCYKGNGDLFVDCRPFPNDDNIEYIKKDAFIEKAKKWFEKRNEWFDIDGNRHCDMESFEDFVNYMKGE